MILEGPDRVAATEIIRDLVLATTTYDGNGAFVRVGLAMLCSYVERAGILDEAGALADSLLEQGVDRLASAGGSCRFIGGLPGVGWMISHLVDESTAAQVCGVIDEVLGEQIDVPRWELDFDFVRGLVGIGMYALARGVQGASLATRVLGHLESSAERSDTGICWFTRPDLPDLTVVSPRGHYDLGVAHGTPGVIGLLARYVAAGIEPARSRALLEGSVSYLLAVAPQRATARFPRILHKGQQEAPPAGLAWCYGDPGVALVLFAAARALRRSDWEAEALTLARCMAGRPFETSGVLDAGLCHGSSGVAHVFHRLFRATGDELLGDAAHRWLRHTLRLRRTNEGYAGYASVKVTDGVEQRYAVPTILGAPGIALVLLAATTDIDPDWDEMLMFGIDPA